MVLALATSHISLRQGEGINILQGNHFLASLMPGGMFLVYGHSTNSLTMEDWLVAPYSIQSATSKPGIIASGLLRLTICKLKMLAMVGHVELTLFQFEPELSSPIQ